MFFSRKPQTPAKTFNEVVAETASLIVDNGYFYYGHLLLISRHTTHATVSEALQQTVERLVASDWDTVLAMKQKMEKIVHAKAEAQVILGEIETRKRNEIRGRLMVTAMNADLTHTSLFLSLAEDNISLDELLRLEQVIEQASRQNFSRLSYKDKVAVGYLS